jgi:hydrogenase expression/formation protein HypC
MKIIKIDGKKAAVESNDHIHTVDLNLIKDPKIGDYILAHADMAINKLPKEEAKKILKIIGEIS